MAIGNVLRNLGSVLNPAVAQEIGQEERQQQTLTQNLGLMALKQKMEQQSPEYQAKVEALKNEKLFREEVAVAGNDMTKIVGAAVKYGKSDFAVNIYNQQENRAMRLQTAADALEARKLQTEQNHQLALQRIQDGQQRQAEVARHNQAMEALNAQNATLNAEIRRQGLVMQGIGVQLQRDRLDADKGKRLDTDITKFSNELQQNKLPNLGASLTGLNDTLRKYEGKDDIPGVGVFEGSKLIPGFLRSREAANVKSALQAVSNDLLNLYSGLAVTLPESERRELEMMANGQFTEQNFKDAWSRTVNRYNTVVGNLKAGQRKEVLDAYSSRPGALRLDPVVPAFANEKKGVPPPPEGFKVD